ncbi:hypothetical protein HYS54_05195, partial [Candidatus Micrarchaeota archaeon]|nr:hypothetical protein [Candidatus Micrarchaeota archaeon]
MNQTGKKLELSPENAIVFAGYGLLFSYYTEHDKFIPLPGVKELVSKLAERNVKIGCLSNTGHNSSTEFASRLEESGIIIPKENVVTAADAALAHIKTRWGSNLRKLRVLFLGRKKGGLYELLQQENVTFVNDPNERAELA